MKKLTIVCITYNHEKYIRDALESIVTQKTNFEFDVLVADDCSTDNTRAIISEYAQKYPNIIKPIFREKNMGAWNNWMDLLERVKTEYMITNEGDDYFCDSLKLQKQVDFLDAHPDYSVCFHNVRVTFEDGSRADYIFPKKSDRFNKSTLSIEHAIKRYFLQTNAVMYRWRFHEENIRTVFPEGMTSNDCYLHLLHAQKGKIGFINEVLSVYRRHSGGVWWEYITDNEKLHLKQGLAMLKFCDEVYHRFTGQPEEYLRTDILPLVRRLILIYLKYEDFDKLLSLKEHYPDYYKKASENIAYNYNLDRKYKKYKKIAFILGTLAVIELVMLSLSVIW